MATARSEPANEKCAGAHRLPAAPRRAGAAEHLDGNVDGHPARIVIGHGDLTTVQAVALMDEVRRAVLADDGDDAEGQPAYQGVRAAVAGTKEAAAKRGMFDHFKR